MILRRDGTWLLHPRALANAAAGPRDGYGLIAAALPRSAAISAHERAAKA